MKEIDGVVEQAYREGNNIIAICKTADGTYLSNCVIPEGSAKHRYLVSQFDMSDPSKVHNTPARFTVVGKEIYNAERRQPAWSAEHIGGTPGI